MSITINRTDEYVDYNVSAPSNRGYLTIDTSSWIDKPWMFYELPALKFEIYTESGEELVKYQNFTREIRTYNPVYSPLGVLNVTVDIRNVPEEFILRITPIFDNDSISARNMLIENGIEDGEIWGKDQDIPTQSFDLDIEFIECSGEYVPPTPPVPPVPPTHEETVTGVPPITLPDAVDGEAVYWEIVGNGIQKSPNLVDPAATVSGYQNQDGTIHEPSGSNERTTDFIPFTQTIYYIVSGSAGGNLNYCFYDANKQCINFWGGYFNANESIAVTPTSGCAYIRISWTNAANQPICVTTERRSSYIAYDAEPTPDAPIMPEFVGVRTANLFDESTFVFSTDTTIVYTPIYVGNGEFTLSTTFPDNETKDVFFIAGNVSSGASSAWNGVDEHRSRSVTSVDGYITIATRYNSNRENPADYAYMLNSGSTALPYEPYGWKLTPTITSGTESTTTPIYLGQTQTVRRIKKVVLTGQETWTEVYPGEPEAQAQGIVMYATDLSEIGTDRNDFRCSHFFVGNYRGYLISGQGRINGMSPECFNVNYNNGSGGLQNFKTWLTSEYTAGHPVTLWYALATEQTAVVNEPLMKIDTYCDTVSSTNTGAPEIQIFDGNNTISFEETIQPSEVTITYTKQGE